MIKAIVFDIYGTLFDIDSVKNKCEKLFPGNGEKIAKAWRQKLIEYIHVRQLVNQYKPFSLVVKDSLEYVLDRNEYDYDSEDVSECVNKYNKLEAFPETEQVLNQLENIDKIVFSNGNEEMILTVLEHAHIEDKFKHIVALEEIGLYKPDSNSYKYLYEKLDLNKEDILFVSSNKWDIIGAQNFGYKTAWINRYLTEFEHIDVEPDYEYQTLYGLISLIK